MVYNVKVRFGKMKREEKLMNFKKLANGSEEGFAVVKRCEERTAKTGSKYLDLVLGDSSGEIPAKMWDYSEANLYNLDDVVKVRGNTEQFNGRDQFRISGIRPVTDADDINIEDLVPVSETGGTEIFNMLRGMVENFRDPDLKKLVGKIMDDKKDILVVCPAAERLHHAVVGGLMEHTAGIVKMVNAVCDVYQNIDRELLTAGAILHDVEKTEEFELSKTGMVSKYSKKGQLIGHIVSGVVCIDETAKKLGIESEKVLLLEHMLLTHHGQPDHGSPLRPMFVEAEILSKLDELDAEIYEFAEATAKVQPGEFTPKQWALDDRKLYNHNLHPNEYKQNPLKSEAGKE